MDHGELIAMGTHIELVRIVGEMSRILLTVSPAGEKVLERWKAVPGVESLTTKEGIHTVLVGDSHAVLPRLFDEASSLDTRITSVDIQEPNLETVFLHLTGRALRD
jgi:ABC-2 type transport system ATP-binding protein